MKKRITNFSPNVEKIKESIIVLYFAEFVEKREK
jgi:hypothetical protein